MLQQKAEFNLGGSVYCHWNGHGGSVRHPDRSNAPAPSGPCPQASARRLPRPAATEKTTRKKPRHATLEHCAAATHGHKTHLLWAPLG